MGQPVKIVDLAERIIRLSGLEPGRDIEIEFTGMRPGERLHEILFAREEPTSEIGIAGVVAARPLQPSLEIDATVAARARTRRRARRTRRRSTASCAARCRIFARKRSDVRQRARVRLREFLQRSGGIGRRLPACRDQLCRIGNQLAIEAADDIASCRRHAARRAAAGAAPK